MKLDQDQYDFSKQLKRVSVKDPAVTKAIAEISAVGKHLVLRTQDGLEAVAMSRNQYERLMTTVEPASSVRQAPTLDGLRAQRDAILGLAAKRGMSNIRVLAPWPAVKPRPTVTWISWLIWSPEAV